MVMPDTLHRSTVFLVNFVVRMFRLGLTKAYGVLIPYLAIQLDASNATIGFLITLHLASGYLCAPLANYLIQRFDYQWVVSLSTVVSSLALLSTAFFMTERLILLCMLLSGCCLAPLLQLIVIALRKLFGDQFGFAFSATFTGAVLGTTVLPYVTMWCYNAYGLRGALLCLNGLGLHLIVVALLISSPSFSGNGLNSCNKQSSFEAGKKSSLHDEETACSTNDDGDYDGTLESMSTINSSLMSHSSTKTEADAIPEKLLVVERKSKMAEILNFIRTMSMYEAMKKEPAVFLIVLPCRLFFEIIYLGWLVFMVSYALSVGINSSQVVYLPMTASLGGLCGRLAQGLLLHKRPSWSSILFVTNIFMSSAAIYGHTFSSSFWNLLMCSFVAGVGMFSGASAYYSLLADLVSDENFSEVLAASSLVSGTGVLLSGFSVGLAYDITHSLVVTFKILSGGLAVISIIISMFVFARRSCNQCGSDYQE